MKQYETTKAESPRSRKLRWAFYSGHAFGAPAAKWSL